MRRYNYQKNNYRRAKFVKRVVLLLIPCAIFALGYGIYKFYIVPAGTTKPVTGIPTVSTGVAGVRSFRSPYFEFEDSASWEAYDQNSSPTKFIYYARNGSLSEQELTVYINQTPPNLAVARALPVKIVNGNAFDVGAISEPCGTAYKPGDLHRVKPLTFSGTTFPCDPETPQFSVILSEVGKTNLLSLKRADDSTATYIIVYRDLRYTPNSASILRIAKSFKSQ